MSVSLDGGIAFQKGSKQKKRKKEEQKKSKRETNRVEKCGLD